MSDIDMITLNEFVAEPIDNLKRFQEFWESHHEDDPAIFPLEMNIEDWIEQFEVYYV